MEEKDIVETDIADQAGAAIVEPPVQVADAVTEEQPEAPVVAEDAITEEPLAEVDEAVKKATDKPIHAAWLELKKALENGLTEKKAFCLTLGDGKVILQAWTPQGTASVSSKPCGVLDDAVKDLNDK